VTRNSLPKTRSEPREGMSTGCGVVEKNNLEVSLAMAGGCCRGEEGSVVGVARSRSGCRGGAYCDWWPHISSDGPYW
jgi:hypothetical protein